MARKLTSVGLVCWRSAALAAALPEEPGACGFGTGALLAEDVVSEPRVPVGGVLAVEPVNPDLDALMRARARLDVDRARAARERAEERLRHEHDAEAASALARANARLSAAGVTAGS